MKRLLPFLLIAIVAVFVIGYFGISRQNSILQTNKCPNIKKVQTVIMKNGSFEPDSLTVQKCTKVVFENKGTQAHWPASNLHPTHGIYPEFDPQQGIEPNQSWSFVFDKAGKWRYHDHLYPAVTGEIIINE